MCLSVLNFLNVTRLDLSMLLSSSKPAEYKPAEYKPSEYKPNEYKANDYTNKVDSVEALSQQTAQLTKETANFMAQFQKNLAAESIKNAVGVTVIYSSHILLYYFCRKH